MSETVISTLPTHQEEENGDLTAGAWTNQLVPSIYKLLKTFCGSLPLIGQLWNRESNSVDQLVCVWL